MPVMLSVVRSQLVMPVMLSVVRIVTASKGWYEARAANPRR
jgi:hypothetical protein